ncbi:MAG: isochorismatase family protein [Rubrivivax sp.]
MQDTTTLLEASCSQLLLVDHQQRLMPAIEGGIAVLANALRLAKLAQALGVPVLGTEQVPEKLGPLDPELRALCSTVIGKHHFDACAGGLAEPVARAASQGRPQVVIAGCETHVCLLQTALGLLAAGHPLWVVADASGSRTAANRELALARLARAGAAIVSTEMVGFEWVRHAAHPQFRLLQQLVR